VAGRGSQVENEVKLRVADAQGARALLERTGFSVVKPRIFEGNDVFDTASASFRSRGELIRVRNAGDNVVLTFKGVAVPGPHKQRPEYETTVGDAAGLRQIFGQLGLERKFRYEKYRTEFQRSGEDGVATLDETPIGVFLELEGDPEWLDSRARELGFGPADYITKSYGTLYFEYCRENGIEPADMVF
jgi:adenylate cyclase class 2